MPKKLIGLRVEGADLEKLDEVVDNSDAANRSDLLRRIIGRLGEFPGPFYIADLVIRPRRRKS